MKGYPRFFRPLLWAILSALLVTGLLLAPSALEMRLEWEVPWRLGPGLRLPVAAVHALLAFVALSVLGALAALHVRAGFRRRRNVVSGLALLLSFAALVLSAVGIYYLGEERPGAWASAIHLVVGLLAPLALTLHFVVARRMRADLPERRTAGHRERPGPAYSSSPQWRERPDPWPERPSP
jgi:hypothetical protein